MLTITLLIRSLAYGGSERQVVVLAKELHKRQHSVVVAVFYSGGPLEKELREAGVRVRVLNKRGRWDTIGFLSRFIRLLYEEKPDTLYSFFGAPNTLTVLLKPIFPRVRIVWGVRGSYLDFAHYDWFVGLHDRVERRLSRFADLIIANSRAGLDHAVGTGFPKDKMVVIPNGIDTERFRPDAGSRRRVRAEWGVTEREKLIGLVGRLHQMKDHPTFLRAAARLSQEREDVRFVCVGEGPAGYRRELHALGEELGLGQRLIWAGARGDMPAVNNALDLAASSSYGEGFPNVVGEAMACGVPCVVTDVGDSARVVGETGVVVPPKNPQALAEGLRAALNGLGQLDPHSLRGRIIRHFSIQALVLNTEQALKGTIEH